MHGGIPANMVLFRFVGEESYSKGSSKDYLIKNGPTWWYVSTPKAFEFDNFADVV